MIEYGSKPEPQVVARCVLEIEQLLSDLRQRHGMREWQAALADVLAGELQREMGRGSLRPIDAWLVIDRARRVAFVDNAEHSRRSIGLTSRIRLCLRALGWRS